MTSSEEEMSRSEVYSTLLDMAIKDRNKELAIYYIKQGAGIDIFKAARVPGDDVFYVKMLVNKGANINAVSSEGSALHEAAKVGNAKIAAFLIAKGIRLNAMDKDGKTALDIAIGETRRVIKRAMAVAAIYKKNNLPDAVAAAKEPSKRQMIAFLIAMSRKNIPLGTKNLKRMIASYISPYKTSLLRDFLVHGINKK